MKGSTVAAETGTGIVMGWKLGVIGGVFLILVTAFAVMTGLRFVPPTPGKEREDLERRLLAGFLCSSTLGVYSGYKFVTTVDPGWLQFWLDVFVKHEDRVLLAWGGALMPFVALFAIAGFWIVAGIVLYLRKREGKDIKEMVEELRS